MNPKTKLSKPNEIKQRVRGEYGPDRKALPLFRQIGLLHDTELCLLTCKALEFINSFPEEYNDIDNPDSYLIAQKCMLKTYFPSTYQQYLLQICNDSSKGYPEECDYDTYRVEALSFKEFIDAYVNPHFRSRIAILPSNDVLDWHIDTNTSYACRVQIILKGSHKFMIQKKNEITQQIMNPGEIWFCNTGYNHRVEVIGDEPRIAILLGCHYNSIGHLL